MTRARMILTKKQRMAPEPKQEVATVAEVTEQDRLARRLAEMVAALTDCDPIVAIDAVRAILATETSLDALEVVAMAVIAVEARERGQLRVPGYVRPDEPNRTVSGRRAMRRAIEPVPDPEPEPKVTVPAPTPDDNVVIDLRGVHATVHLDLT